MVSEEVVSRHYEGRWVFELARPSPLAAGVLGANGTVLRDGQPLCHITLVRHCEDATSLLEAVHVRCVQWVRDWELRAADTAVDMGAQARAGHARLNPA